MNGLAASLSSYPCSVRLGLVILNDQSRVSGSFLGFLLCFLCAEPFVGDLVEQLPVLVDDSFFVLDRVLGVLGAFSSVEKPDFLCSGLFVSRLDKKFFFFVGVFGVQGTLWLEEEDFSPTTRDFLSLTLVTGDVGSVGAERDFCTVLAGFGESSSGCSSTVDIRKRSGVSMTGSGAGFSLRKDLPLVTPGLPPKKFAGEQSPSLSLSGV
mmetsp:Transcript_13104/g.24829  ORF Transcript_13104/g.24829 Transcript_13104/m.24829 type:complete len:209 (-) Transcript_13104:2119-2745(-)